jgi:hypothetical protein
VFTKCTAAALHTSILVCGYNSGEPSQCGLYNTVDDKWTKIAAPVDPIGNKVIDSSLIVCDNLVLCSQKMTSVN